MYILRFMCKIMSYKNNCHAKRPPDMERYLHTMYRMHPPLSCQSNRIRQHNPKSGKIYTQRNFRQVNNRQLNLRQTTCLAAFVFELFPPQVVSGIGFIYLSIPLHKQQYLLFFLQSPSFPSLSLLWKCNPCLYPSLRPDKLA